MYGDDSVGGEKRVFENYTFISPATEIFVFRDGPVECEHGVPRDDNNLNNTRRAATAEPVGIAVTSGGVRCPGPSRLSEKGYASAEDGNKS